MTRFYAIFVKADEAKKGDLTVAQLESFIKKNEQYIKHLERIRDSITSQKTISEKTIVFLNERFYLQLKEKFVEKDIFQIHGTHKRNVEKLNVVIKRHESSILKFTEENERFKMWIAEKKGLTDDPKCTEPDKTES